MKNIKCLSLISVLLLSACASNPASYLPSGVQPIINVEANIDPSLLIDAQENSLAISNKTEQPLSIIYKLFWYDKFGVTQGYTAEMGQKTDWYSLWLEPHQTMPIQLDKPTEESVKYRLYVRGQ